MFRIDVLGSRHGDCLIIHYGTSIPPKRILVDGGPHKVYRPFLRPHLRNLKETEGLNKPVEFELAMVSHIDQDHIIGLIELTDEMIEEEDSTRDPARIKRFWHNSFSDLTGGTSPAALTATVDAIVASANVAGTPPFQELANSDGRATEILASVNQGRKLRDNLIRLGLDGNRPFNNALVLSGKSAELPGNMNLTVIGPDKERLEKLQKEWNPALDPSEIAAITDNSVSNLASIVVLAEHDGKKLLLTGDARGDDIVEWLEELGLKEKNKPFPVDALKVPHHGSNNNVDPAYFRAVPAKTYIYCGDGGHDNPEPETLKMMREARQGDNYRVILSSFVEMEHSAKQPEFEAELKKLASAGIEVDARDPDDLFISVDM
ncbi:ComEC/Rec2 family competence protein [Pararhizobium sp. IMCC21322]|uniref:ComEC/Rec2 family competence protein n=1 Tax=Pararhizobium sp. IMCC21322 TaxID=3067903 RepID=UPI002741E05C|nr:hypothetical protein [Pararhizobium sp. IMCC21322]